MPNPVDPTYVHFLYSNTHGRLTLCGVCLRHRCSEDLEKIDCPRCLRLARETDILKMIEEES